MSNFTELHNIADEVQRLVREVQDTPPELIWAAMRTNIGPIVDYMAQLKAIYPKAEGGGQPEPPPPAIDYGVNHYGTYQGHGHARDNYPRGRGQNSEGFIRRLPIDVRLEAYTFTGPLYDSGFLYVPEYTSFASLGLVRVLGTSLHTRVAYPVQRLVGGLSGKEIKAFWCTHVEQNSPTSLVQAGGVVWTVWDSGIEFERLGIKAEAAHEHWAISYSGNLSPDGEGPAEDLFVALQKIDPNWRWLNVGAVPGPQEYLARRGWRGLLQSPPA